MSPFNSYNLNTMFVTGRLQHELVICLAGNTYGYKCRKWSMINSSCFAGTSCFQNPYQVLEWWANIIVIVTSSILHLMICSLAENWHCCGYIHHHLPPHFIVAARLKSSLSNFSTGYSVFYRLKSLFYVEQKTASNPANFSKYLYLDSYFLVEKSNYTSKQKKLIKAWISLHWVIPPPNMYQPTKYLIINWLFRF